MSYVSQQRPASGGACLQGGQRDYSGYMARSAYDPLAFSYGRSSPCQAAASGQYQLNGQYGVHGVPGVPGVPTSTPAVSSHSHGSGTFMSGYLTSLAILHNAS